MTTLISLSDREHEMLRCLFNGASRGEVANRLQISVATIDNHITSICRKLNVINLTQAFSCALNLKLLEKRNES